MSEKPVAAIAARAEAVKAALIEKELLSAQQIEEFEQLAEAWRPENGARVVARAWTDPAFRERLITDATAACAEIASV